MGERGQKEEKSSKNIQTGMIDSVKQWKWVGRTKFRRYSHA